MKKAIASWLLLIMLLNGVGFYVYYGLELARIRSHMRNQLRTLPDHELQKLTLTKDVFQKSLVDDREIRLEGQMYDIARIQHKGNQVIVFCLRDEKEENLIAFVTAIISSPFEQDELPSVVTNFLTLIYLIPERDRVEFNNSLADQSFWTDKNPKLHLGYHFQHLQPPESIAFS